MTRVRSGFTFVEMMIVFVIFALVVAITGPRAAQYTDQSKVRSAKVQIASTLATARAAAIQHGRVVRVETSGTKMVTIVDPNGTPALLGDTLRLGELFRVSLSASQPQIDYDSRGLRTAAATAAGKYVVTRGHARDSVCVTATGSILRKGCI